MSSKATSYNTLALTTENIGGINETHVELSNGTTILQGKNATNRTSFLQSVMAAMGSDAFNLKGDADHGRVQLTLDDTVVEREFNRRNGIVESSSDGYLDDPELANLFAFLLEENEARQAVARGDNLREVITRPIDTEEINTEIDRLQSEKRQLDEKIEHIEDRERELVELEQRKNRLQTEVEERRERLSELEAEIEDADTDLEKKREEQEQVEDQLDRLKELRSQLEDIRFKIETTNETIESLKDERDEKRDTRENLTVDSETDVSSLRDELDKLRDRKRQVNTQTNELQSIIQFNEDMLSGTDSEIADVLRDDSEDDSGDGAITDRLLEGEESVVCWTCGSEVSRGDITDTLDRLQSFREEKLSTRESIQREIDETKEQVSELEDSQRELQRLNQRLAEIETEIEKKQGRIEDLEQQRDDIHEEIEDLEEAVEQTQSSDYSDLLDLHKEANQVELELEQKEDTLASVEDEIADIESLVADRDEYEERREQINEQLEELRNRIDRLERNAIEEFNSRMEDVLNILEYENIARVWIERQERETRQGRRKIKQNHFELHIVRESESGQTYEGTIDTLSESEREVVGLVFALAGYLVHNLHETVPVMLLDSLEAIDSGRIARLIEYFADYPDFLVVALLPEDADAIDIDHETVTQI
ncbi:archaea-specific SMC-related protein [Halorussus salinisoli]|uniref:archaea-specific SMC-related protein n=1 Tax=Halorussus salinisoli TaxID=2558242 RepID=UPI0010C1B9CD|nr:archaea-specific SMC-related protein [Halorussus salinisoli]